MLLNLIFGYDIAIYPLHRYPTANSQPYTWNTNIPTRIATIRALGVIKRREECLCELAKSEKCQI